jgi:alpha-mannosidase
VDSFGHAAGLPQLLARAGYDAYVFMRPSPEEYGGPLPRLFWWESPDGARVLTWRVPTPYCQGAAETPEQFEQTLRHAASMGFAPGFGDGLFLLGVGNHGGGPTRRQIERILALRGDAELPELRFSTLRDFFAAVRRAPAFTELSVVRGELQHHATGCYAAMGEIKALNRRAESALVQGETLSALAGMTGPWADRRTVFQEAWWAVLFNQFHDILAGSAIMRAYTEARDGMGGACAVGDAAAVGAVHALARRIDTAGAPEGVLVLANPLPWACRMLVQCDTLMSPLGDTPITYLLTRDGTPLPLQWLPQDALVSDGWVGKLTAVVPLPAGGYRALHLAHGEARECPAWSGRAEVREGTLGVASLRAADGTELLDAPVGFVVVADTSDTWGHGVLAYRDEAGRPTLQSTTVVADGPVCRQVRQRATWGRSEILLDILTYREIDAVELRVRVNWQEAHEILKLEVPTRLQAARTVAAVPGGVAARATGGGEEPCQEWVAVEGDLDGQPYALGMMNDRTYSYDCLAGLLRTAIARSAPAAHHAPLALTPEMAVTYLDQGWQERRFWLLGAPGDHHALCLHRRAAELACPAHYAVDAAHPGSEPWERTLLSVAPEALAVTAVKAAEEGEGVVVRLQEMAGVPARAHLRLPALGIDWAGPIGPYELLTLKIAGGAVRVVDILERPYRL